MLNVIKIIKCEFEYIIPYIRLTRLQFMFQTKRRPLFAARCVHQSTMPYDTKITIILNTADARSQTNQRTLLSKRILTRSRRIFTCVCTRQITVHLSRYSQPLAKSKYLYINRACNKNTPIANSMYRSCTYREDFANLVTQYAVNAYTKQASSKYGHVQQ